MGQHLDTFLNQKYGLKAMSAEWRVAILKALDKFVGVDSDVALYKAILNNQVDEDYRTL